MIQATGLSHELPMNLGQCYEGHPAIVFRPGICVVSLRPGQLRIGLVWLDSFLGLL